MYVLVVVDLLLCCHFVHLGPDHNHNPQLIVRKGDRVDDHMTDFDQYKSVGAVGSNLGKFIEIGEKAPSEQSDPSSYIL
jgi:hypothetical protein